MNGPTIVAVMLAGYLLVMGVLGIAVRAGPTTPAQRPRPAGRRRGWPGLVRQVAGTAVGGYLLLMAVVLAYYHGVAGLGGGFLVNALTGSALLLALALPPFLAASWLVERRRRKHVGRGAAER